MMDLDDLSNALRDAAAAQPEVADGLEAVTRRGRQRRRRTRAVLGGITAVVLVAGGLVLADGGDTARVHTVDEPPSATRIDTGDPCPGSVIRRIDGGDPAADALPPLADASVDRGRVTNVFAEHRDELLQGFGASRVEIGAGFGRAWAGENGGDYSVVDVDDFSILVEVPDDAGCPQGAALHQRLEGVPLFFFVKSTAGTTPDVGEPTAACGELDGTEPIVGAVALDHLPPGFTLDGAVLETSTGFADMGGEVHAKQRLAHADGRWIEVDSMSMENPGAYIRDQSATVPTEDVAYDRCVDLTSGPELLEYQAIVAHHPDRTVVGAQEWEYGGFVITGGPGVTVDELLSIASGLRQPKAPSASADS